MPKIPTAVDSLEPTPTELFQESSQLLREQLREVVAQHRDSPSIIFWCGRTNEALEQLGHLL